jgi:hypothetical protein
VTRRPALALGLALLVACLAVAALSWGAMRLLVGAADGWSIDETLYGSRADDLVADLRAIDGVTAVDRAAGSSARAPHLRITLADGSGRAGARIHVLAACGIAREAWDPGTVPFGGPRPELVCEIVEAEAEAEADGP